MTAVRDVLHLRLSPEVFALVDQAAAARGQKPAHWHRQAIRTQLALEGFDIPIAVRPSAGDEWALVARGNPDRIVTRCRGAKPDLADVSHHPAGYVPSEGDAWVPIEECDTEPFDPDRHWRLAPPTYQIVSVYDRPDRVRRVFTVVEKSWEHA